jgi:LDH2 family malate/lactate/ureidoglycolate dehydrogenase
MSVAVPHRQLSAFAEQFLMAAGADAASSAAAARALLHASLHGIDSHGIRLLPWYGKCLKGGLVNGHPRLTLTPLRRAAAKVDADGGMGHLASYRAMEEACALAGACGIGLALVVNSSHFGAAGAYALAAAQAGYIGFVTCNSGAYVVPHGGSVPIHGTNPIALAAPNPGGEAFLLDMATSAIPWNKVLRYRTEEIELPQEVAVDRGGRFTTDAAAAAHLSPLGGRDFGYKGAALAGLADVLGGVLTGMRLSSEQDLTQLGDTQVGHLLMAIDPTLLMSLSAFGLRLEDYYRGFAAQPGTMAAGGPEWRRRDDRLRHGVPLPDGLVAELSAAAAEHGIEFPF